ncbi:hypothetical protein LTS18_009632, partial [Coniosporium uncinatum]
DPFKRIDVLPTQRKVKITLPGPSGDVVLADSTHALLLIEPLLPVRYYIPQPDCRLDLLRESDLRTKCPYKGEAEYYDIVLPAKDGMGKMEGDGEVVKDVVWWYRYPTAESVGVAGMLCFYNEKVDVWVDGVKQERPKTHFA